VSVRYGDVAFEL